MSPHGPRRVGRSSIGGLPEPDERLREGLRALKSLGPYLWPRDSWELRARVVLAVALLIGGKLVTIAIPWFYKHAVDALANPNAALIAVPVAAILAYGLARVLSQGFNQLRDGVFAKVEQRAVRRIALSVFRHIHALSLRFHLERRTGGLARAIERGTAGIEFLLSFMLFNIVPTVFEIAVVSAILWRLYNWQFAVVTLATILVYIAFTFIVTDWRVRFRREMNNRNTEANTKSVDALLNYETVKYFANEAHEAERYDRALAAYERAAVRSQTTLSLLNIGQGAIIAGGLIGVMILAAEGVAARAMTVGDFVLVNTYLIQLYTPLNFLGMVYRNIKQSLTDLEQMMGLLKIRPEIEDRPAAPALVVRRGAVAFRHVDFRYDRRRPILHDVDFAVPPGAKVAIVGPSGAGKSTIARLLFRFYDVDGGAIEIDGQDLREVTQDSLRRTIGVVPQDTVLFNDTIYYNIAYGRPGAGRAEIEAAARRAHIHDFVAGLPDGYETMVGERGLKLSGGEKQRVAIARVVLKAPPILVFDEATSALDTKTEREIQGALDRVAANRTTVVIAHRLSTIINADEIIVLDHGRIAERGTHAGLPDGYQTLVGERGLKLSGGEKQRVAIARTILKSPPILLFDEATSALDSRTEREIQANLMEI
ncbi:MAG TPA: ATP-binding cassette domain-containing protein, partial [Stellaceae bacterium]|nr:ATP-binding cassette domain-containing protein [Stellaceae bacterium]